MLGCTTGNKCMVPEVAFRGVGRRVNVAQVAGQHTSSQQAARAFRSAVSVARQFERNTQGKMLRWCTISPWMLCMPFLQPDASPTIFPNVPHCLSKPVPKKRKPKGRLEIQIKLRLHKNAANMEGLSLDELNDAPAHTAANSLDYRNVIIQSQASTFLEHLFHRRA